MYHRKPTTNRKHGRKRLPEQAEVVHADRRTRRKRTRGAAKRAALAEWRA